MDGTPLTIASNLKALGSLMPGAAGRLEAFDKSAHQQSDDMIDRLREMGFAEGLQIELLHHSVFGKDPIVVRVGAMTVALRRREANLIKVQLA